MGKQPKKKKLSLRMKRAIRRTIGGVFLVSALIVAIIPEKDTQAGATTPTVTVLASETSIPTISASDTVYTTGDGMFQFAYIEKGSGGDKVAVIVGYDYARNLIDGTLTIPNTVDAYVKYTHSEGTEGGYVAVGKSGDILYYPTYKEVSVGTGTFGDDGAEIMTTQTVIDTYQPCLFSNHDAWAFDSNGTPRDAKDYYYYDGSDYQQTTSESNQRIQNATVAYISSQHVIKNDTGWELDSTPDVGIFSKATNITKLITGQDLLGIGDYAFYQCASLKGIELGDGANTIGNYAFANCVNLTYATFPTNSSILAIGDHAFYNCRSLKSFTVPVAVQKIGDSAFEGCADMKTIDLNANGQQVLLSQLGPNVFKNCTKLQSITFPLYFAQDFDLTWISGCTSLQYIKVPNTTMKIVDSSTFSFENFMNMVTNEFYFEGADSSAIHTISTTNSFAFKYLDEEIYEKVYNASGEAGSGQIIFRVNDSNELIYFNMDSTVKQVAIPGTIGPYQITVIGSGSFQANHNLTKIAIPSSITQIQDNAFKGCHRLKDVIFEEPVMLTSIGEGAFDTQVIDPILDTCTLDSVPVLTFTGSAQIGSLPFDYAMNPSNNINRGSQPLTYITFYSGWPSNLTITYNPESNKVELTDYPILTDLSMYSSNMYPYISSENAAAAASAYAAYLSGGTMTQDQKDIISSALNIDIPNGVQAIKTGIFSNTDENGVTMNSSGHPNTDILTVTMGGIDDIAPYTFAGCNKLVGAYINGDTQSIGDYAFNECTSLAAVTVTDQTQTLGTRPFAGCTTLSDVDFGTNPNFDCSDAIIYGTENGTKIKVIEALESRGATYGTGAVTATELAGINEIAPEAFENCDGILSVDLSKAENITIPERCFANTDGLYSVVLADNTRKIAKEAFKDSNIRYLELPNSMSVIDNSAFEDDTQTITFYCEKDSASADYADNYSNIVVSEKPVTYKVSFYDEDGVTLLDQVTVNAGADATTTVTPTKTGYIFKAWLPSPTAVTANLNTYATYADGTNTYTVTFIDYDDKVLYTQNVKEGESAITPAGPTRTGYTFTGWRPAFTNITEDTKVYAQYEKTTATSSGTGNSSGTNGNAANGNSAANTTLYTLTVKDGSGSGSYISGANVILIAGNAPTGKVFDKWTCDNTSVTFASATVSATTIKMPAANITVTANYKDGTTTGNNAATGNSANSSNGNSSSGGNKVNTTISVDKDGISNEDKASATVSGSTDNYVVKVTDSATAKQEIEEALLDKFGTLDDIKYFAMDISLYDSTGKNKIANTDGLKVTITLPIPDALVEYAGNNKVAYVVNGKIVEITPKYTTINGVPCVTFVAPHFSPYTLYVDTTNLSAGTIKDATPKTGDPIAPKWFLALGLLCVSIALFAKRDHKHVLKQKA